MNIDTLKAEFYNQLNRLLEQLVILDINLKDIINNKYKILNELYIVEINKNISPFINDIIVKNYKVFEDNSIELLEGINLSKLWINISVGDKDIICNYLQTLYLIVNTYDKEHRTDEMKDIMKQIKHSLSINKPAEVKEEEPIKTDTLNDDNNDPMIDAMNQIKNTCGNNDFMDSILNLAGDIFKSSNIDMKDLMSGGFNADKLTNVLKQVTTTLKAKQDTGDLNMDKLQMDGMNFMKNLLSNSNTNKGKSNQNKGKSNKRNKKK